MSSETIVARTLLHSTYVADTGDGGDAIVVSEIIENDKGEVKPNLKVYRNPTISFWVTQKPYRTHTDKKEFESLQFLDEYKVPYKDRDREIFSVFNGYKPKFLSYQQKRELQTNPYLYGGNISIEAMVGLKYKKDLVKNNKISHSPTTGFFDIEKSLLPSSIGKLPLMTFTAENKVYLAIKKSFMYEERKGQFIPVSVEDIKNGIDEYITPLINSIFENEDGLKDLKHKLPFSYELFVGETEIEMIRWIFGKMHESKVSFIGIWNLGFDISEILRILEEENIPPEEIFVDPSLVGTGYSYFNYKPDNRKKVAHWSLKWNWVTSSAHFQFVDSLALFSYIRIVDGKEASYALDDVLKKYGLGGKLKLVETEAEESTADWHREMLSKHFMFYSLYAMWDAISLQLLEWRNNDLTSMLLTVDATPVKFFPNQTIKATTTLFEDWLPKGYVLGTGVDMEGLADDDLLSEGGGVLDPQNLIAKGVALFEEWPSHHTQCYFWVSDLDFKAQYPTNMIGLNISKQTKIATMINIKGSWVQKLYTPSRAVEVACSYIVTPAASGYDLGHEFFNLPSYLEMDELFKNRNAA